MDLSILVIDLPSPYTSLVPPFPFFGRDRIGNDLLLRRGSWFLPLAFDAKGMP